MIVVQNFYYALPGKEREVLALRLHACDVIESLGCKRGRVFVCFEDPRREPLGPDVIWQVEYDSMERLKSEPNAGQSDEMQAVFARMERLVARFERHRWSEVESATDARGIGS